MTWYNKDATTAFQSAVNNGASSFQAIQDRARKNVQDKMNLESQVFDHIEESTLRPFSLGEKISASMYNTTLNDANNHTLRRVRPLEDDYAVALKKYQTQNTRFKHQNLNNTAPFKLKTNSLNAYTDAVNAQLSNQLTLDTAGDKLTSGRFDANTSALRSQQNNIYSSLGLESTLDSQDVIGETYGLRYSNDFLREQNTNGDAALAGTTRQETALIKAAVRNFENDPVIQQYRLNPTELNRKAAQRQFSYLRRQLGNLSPAVGAGVNLVERELFTVGQETDGEKSFYANGGAGVINEYANSQGLTVSEDGGYYLTGGGLPLPTSRVRYEAMLRAGLSLDNPEMVELAKQVKTDESNLATVYEKNPEWFASRGGEDEVPSNITYENGSVQINNHKLKAILEKKGYLAGSDGSIYKEEKDGTFKKMPSLDAVELLEAVIPSSDKPSWEALDSYRTVIKNATDKASKAVKKYDPTATDDMAKMFSQSF